ncbi:MAG: threonine synthase [Spirochaetaceae bacterium]|jgi:threonine synthase|nr:threonine synthase [Spirochaetaceae bacterium]
MKYYSTRGGSAVSFANAALSGIAPDGGLFVPEAIPQYSSAAISSFSKLNFLELAYETIEPFVSGEIPQARLIEIIESAFNFPCPLVKVNGKTGAERFILELFHGPTAAFKDFGARFMARAFSYLRRGEDKPLQILVATSGDTGGAVADGFFGIEGITVTVLYPKGRVSELQEKQIAGLGNNVRAFAVEGSFDDCQRMVKEAFAEVKRTKRGDFSSANSINIARLVPQTVYYAEASARLPGSVVCVPSGNFGNLTAGLYAQAMGAPINHFIAATNINKTFPEYIATGRYNPRASVATISNAMDVGAPSNFERLSFHWDYDAIKKNILSVFIDDEATRAAIKAVWKKTGCFLDPHGAVGWAAVDKLEEEGRLSAKNSGIIILETAHPAKFAPEVEPLTGNIPVPPALEQVMSRAVNSTTIPAKTSALLEFL